MSMQSKDLFIYLLMMPVCNFLSKMSLNLVIVLDLLTLYYHIIHQNLEYFVAYDQQYLYVLVDFREIFQK